MPGRMRILGVRAATFNLSISVRYRGSADSRHPLETEAGDGDHPLVDAHLGRGINPASNSMVSLI